MVLNKALKDFGKYWMFMARVFTVPDRWNVFGRRTVQEIFKLGIDSIPLVIVISIFIGAVITIQMQLNTTSPLLPAYSVGLAARDIVLLEFSNSILCLILAGKVGSNIASEIGTMRVTEQIDALDIMGVNSANYLVLPKVVGFIFFMPVLVAFCIFFSMIGGLLSQFYGCYFNREIYLRYTGVLPGMVCMVWIDQIIVLCIRNCNGIVLLWLFCQRWFSRSGKSEYKCRCFEQYSDIAA